MFGSLCVTRWHLAAELSYIQEQHHGRYVGLRSCVTSTAFLGETIRHRADSRILSDHLVVKHTQYPS